MSNMPENGRPAVRPVFCPSCGTKAVNPVEIIVWEHESAQAFLNAPAGSAARVMVRCAGCGREFMANVTVPVPPEPETTPEIEISVVIPEEELKREPEPEPVREPVPVRSEPVKQPEAPKKEQVYRAVPVKTEPAKKKSALPLILIALLAIAAIAAVIIFVVLPKLGGSKPAAVKDVAENELQLSADSDRYAEVDRIGIYEVGDVVFFGKYEGKQLAWVIAALGKDNSALLVTREVLPGTGAAVLSGAFTEAEEERILTVKQETPDGSCEDKIFLPSCYQAKLAGNASEAYLLREAGIAMSAEGKPVYSEAAGVRPAVWVTLPAFEGTENVLKEDGITHYYAVYCLEPGMDFAAMEAYCEKLGGHLATLTSQGQNNAAYAVYEAALHDGSVITEKRPVGVFGLTDAEKEGDWHWVTGEEYSYANWAPEEPNGGDEENYANFYKDNKENQWNDGGIDTEKLFAFIFEVDIIKSADR